MTTQHTIYAPTEADLTYLLTDLGVLRAGRPVDGMGWEYLGPWSLSGAAMASVHALVWWTAPPADAAEASAREQLMEGLRQRRALYEGAEQPVRLLGTSGPQRPSDHAYVGILRDAQRMRCGVLVGGHWFHTDAPSRDLYLQAAALVALGANPAPVPWKTMSGAFVSMTPALLGQVLAALATSDAVHHQVAEQARAALAAGTLSDVSAIVWPATYGA